MKFAHPLNYVITRLALINSVCRRFKLIPAIGKPGLGHSAAVSMTSN